MKQWIGVIGVVLLLVASMPALAQDDGGKCTPNGIYTRVETLYAGYEAQQASIETPEQALEQAQAFSAAVNSVVQACIAMTAEVQVSRNPQALAPGDGTLDNPYPVGQQVDTGAGFSVRVTEFQRRADAAVADANMFNKTPGVGEEYVLVHLEVECPVTETTCDVNWVPFELVGDNGVFYEYPYIVFDNLLDVTIVGGNRVEGVLPFLIQSNDRNLRLVYRPNLFGDELIALLVE